MDEFAPLLRWYDENKRDLPWRHTHDPYRIWVSEIMLQQTRATAVIPYYTRFFEALPDVYALAACDEEKLLKLWEGLGYYSRARNLKKCAERIVTDRGGVFPEEAEELKKLPGIGAYTAGAVASIAFSKCEPAVDGNVLRILARFRNDGRNILSPAAQEDHRRYLKARMSDRAGALNQAFMDLGTLVCLPKDPHCAACPLQNTCGARTAGTEKTLPYREKPKPRRKEQLTVFCLLTERGYIIRRRAPSGLLPGLYEFPHTPGRLGTGEALAYLNARGLGPQGELLAYERKHVFTHIEWEMHVIFCRTEAKLFEDCLFYTGTEALPAAFSKCLPEETALPPINSKTRLRS